MSTKIYDVYRLPEFKDCSAQTLAGFMRRMNAGLCAAINAEAQRFYMDYYVRRADSHSIGEKVYKQNSLELRKEAKEFYDCSYMLFVFDGEVYFKSFSYATMTKKAVELLATPHEDVSYWDNSDKPDEISAADWKARREFWDKNIPGVWAEHGFSCRPYGDYSFPQPDFETAEFHPSLGTRAKELAESLVSSEMMQGIEEDRISEYMRMRRTDEFKQKSAAKTAELVKSLPPSYAPDKLLEIIRALPNMEE